MPAKIIVPADVSQKLKAAYIKNYNTATQNSGNLMLFAGDQKVEHLNDDFYGPGIHEDDHDPVHLFNIAKKAQIGVFATQLGMIARYGNDFKSIPYVVKLNSKTSAVKTEQKDPSSPAWFTVEDVIAFKKTSKLNIVGIGFTIYVGSEYENDMFKEAAQAAWKAHQNGMIAIFWMYPRGKAIKDEKDPHLIAGAAGIGACLGADFVKVNYPKKDGISTAAMLQEAVKAAGRTKVVCAGGTSTGVEGFLKTLHEQIHIGGAVGNATGRNVHQRSLAEAVRFCNAINAVTVKGASVEQAMKIYNKK